MFKWQTLTQYALSKIYSSWRSIDPIPEKENLLEISKFFDDAEFIPLMRFCIEVYELSFDDFAEECIEVIKVMKG